MFLKIHHDQVELIQEMQENTNIFTIAKRRKNMIVLVSEKKADDSVLA